MMYLGLDARSMNRPPSQGVETILHNLVPWLAKDSPAERWNAWLTD